MTAFTAILIFILGTAIGSFLSVVIYRIHSGTKGIFWGRSICTSSKKYLKWRHLVPIFSYIFLRGKSAYTGERISVHYLLLEIVSGLVFLATFLSFNFVLGIPSSIDPSFLNYSVDWHTFEFFLYHIVLFSFLIAIFFYDLLYKEIPDQLSLPAIALAIAGGLVLGTPTLTSMIIGGTGIFLFFFLQYVLSKGKWIGGGDIRLGALLGVMLGWDKGLLAVIVAYIIGATISLILMASGKVTKKTAVPFGPFLATGAFIAALHGEEIIQWYISTVTV